MSVSTEIGYWPEPAGFSLPGLRVRPLPSIDALIEQVRASPGVHNRWAFAPPQRTIDIPTGRERTLPFPSRVFGLPKTHVMEVDAGRPTELPRFAVWCLGFFVGMRLSETQAGYLDATPIEPGALCDFYCAVANLPRALQPALEFLLTHQANGAAETMLAAIHALWLSQTPNLLRFERYHYAYVALDALSFVAVASGVQAKKSKYHHWRLADLAACLNIGLPDWPGLVTERNNAIHQGLFYGQPLGFTADIRQSRNPVTEIKAFICRAIVKLLGVPAPDYISSPCMTYQRHGLF